MSEIKGRCCESDGFYKSAEMENDTVLCRCEEVTIGTARKWIAEGYDTFDEIKRMLRVGMGPCQGRGCRDILLREISQITGRPISEISPGTIRPPVKPIKVSLVARDYTGGDKK
jgi:bacterioferritin-associated ferredoxin